MRKLSVSDQAFAGQRRHAGSAWPGLHVEEARLPGQQVRLRLAGTVLISFACAKGPDAIFWLDGTVGLSPGSLSTIPDVPMLTMAGWYNMVQMRDDNKAAGGAVLATM
jgi:hypothetical protein